MLMILLSNLSVIGHLCDLWQQLKLASELDSDLREIVDWAGSGMLISILEKTQLISFDRSNYFDAINVNMDGSVLEKRSSLKMLKLSFSYVLD